MSTESSQNDERVYTFSLAVKRDAEGWWTATVFERDGVQYAEVSCRDLGTTLRMTVPYLADCCQPDPFADVVPQGPPPTRDDLFTTG